MQDITTTIQTPYLLFLGDAKDELSAKTSRGVAEWRPHLCLGEHRLPGCQTTLGLPEMSYKEAVEKGARTLIVGVVNAGGTIAESWVDDLIQALEAGLNLASGLHQRLRDIPALRECADWNGRQLHDVRHPVATYKVGTGLKRSGKRLLTVGTDCSCGKMFTTLSLEKEMHERGIAADFRATGQTGIFISGRGICVDAVIADFISGAAEALSPDNDPGHWDLIEGQGSLYHPSFAGVSLGLLHGAQPDALVLCHQPNRPHMRGLPHRQVPDLRECLELNLSSAALTSPGVQCAGISINGSRMKKEEAADYRKKLEDDFGIPCIDPMATGVGAIIDRLEKL